MYTIVTVTVYHRVRQNNADWAYGYWWKHLYLQHCRVLRSGYLWQHSLSRAQLVTPFTSVSSGWSAKRVGGANATGSLWVTMADQCMKKIQRSGNSSPSTSTTPKKKEQCHTNLWDYQFKKCIDNILKKIEKRVNSMLRYWQSWSYYIVKTSSDL